MNQGQQLLKNTGLLAVGKLTGYAATFGVIPFYTQTLDPSQYAMVDLVVVYVALFVPLATLRLENAVFRWITAGRDDTTFNGAGYLTFALRVLAVSLVVMSAGSAVLYAGWRNPAVPAFALLLAIQSLNAVLGEYVRANGFTQHYTVGGMLNGIVLFVVTIIVLVVFEWGVTGAYIGLLAGPLACLVWLAATAYRIYQPGPRVNSRERRRMLAFSLPLVGSAMAWYLILVTDRSIILWFLGLTGTGNYALASKMASILLVVFPIFGMALTESAILNFQAENRDVFFNRTYNLALRADAALAILVIGGFAVLSPIIAPKGYEASIHLVPLLVFSAFLNNVVTLFDPIHVAARSTRVILRGSVAILAINAVLHFSLIPSIGLFASAVASNVALGTVALWRHREASKIVSLSFGRMTVGAVATAFSITSLAYYIEFPTHYWVCAAVALMCSIGLLAPLVQTRKAKH